MSSRTMPVLQTEIVWVDEAGKGSNEGAMVSRGHLDFLFPKVDLPLNVVLMSVWVPSSFRYGEFTVRYSDEPGMRSLYITHRET